MFMYKLNSANENIEYKEKKKYKSKLKDEDKKVKTIAFRVTEKEYDAFKSNKEMQTLIIKYCRMCLSFLYIDKK